MQVLPKAEFVANIPHDRWTSARIEDSAWKRNNSYNSSMCIYAYKIVFAKLVFDVYLNWYFDIVFFEWTAVNTCFLASACWK